MVEFTKKQIASRYGRYSAEASWTIDNFFSFWGQNTSTVLRLKQKERQRELEKEDSVMHIIKGIIEFFPLMSHTKENCMMILQLTLLVKYSFKSYNHMEMTNNYRTALDGLMKLPLEEFTYQEMANLFTNISTLNLYYWYYAEANKIIKHFLQALDPNWERNVNQRAAMIRIFLRLGIYN